MTILRQFNIGNGVDANDLWASAGKEFDGFLQAVAELFDDSISNIVGSNSMLRNIMATILELDDGRIKFSIEDSGSGMSAETLGEIFSIANSNNIQTNLNEHGCGMKHALAFVNEANDSWLVATRTERLVEEDRFILIKSPYSFDMEAKEVRGSWPGEYTGSGTYIEFISSREIFLTIANGCSELRTLADILFEDIGYRYSEIIKNAKVNIMFNLKLKDIEIKKPIGPVIPLINRIEKNRADIDMQGFVYIDLNSGMTYDTKQPGTILMRYTFCRMDHYNDERTLFDNTVPKRYYNPSMRCSGVEIRIDGRVIEKGLFDEIWNVARHNSYNSLLVMIDLITEKGDVLPKTRTSKTGFVRGTKELANLFKWVKSVYPNVNAYKIKGESERQRFNRIATTRATSHMICETEMYCFTSIPQLNGNSLARLDMYEANNTGKKVFFEGKNRKTKILDVYQMRMYWDGLVLDGITPTCGKLIAPCHPDGVKAMVEYLNSIKDQNGNYYNFELCSWDEIDKK